jgi:carbonic anhydrase
MPGHPQINPYKPYDFDAANKNYVENVFDEPDMVVGARSRVGIITCCDARCSPDHFFQLKPNEAFVIRNGGGRTATDDVIRTLTGIQILSDISELKVIHHTGKLLAKSTGSEQPIDQNSSKYRLRCVGRERSLAPGLDLGE